MPNQTQQADLIGPCYLKGPIRFYSLNVVDTATVRCGLYPALTKSGQTVIDGFWNIWKRIGLPERVQVDNAMSFYGSRKHPRGMGPLIRPCLHYGVEPWVIPVAEPWRNGMIESFNDRYQQKFLRKVVMTPMEDLQSQSLCFEERHNRKYRYSKLKGNTPLKAFSTVNTELRFPVDDNPLTRRLKKKTSRRAAHQERSQNRHFGRMFSRST